MAKTKRERQEIDLLKGELELSRQEVFTKDKEIADLKKMAKMFHCEIDHFGSMIHTYCPFCLVEAKDKEIADLKAERDEALRLKRWAHDDIKRVGKLLDLIGCPSIQESGFPYSIIGRLSTLTAKIVGESWAAKIRILEAKLSRLTAALNDNERAERVVRLQPISGDKERTMEIIRRAITDYQEMLKGEVKK